MPFFLILCALFVLFCYAVLQYNALVRHQHAIRQHWDNIDTLMRQRHDELPRLIERAHQHAQFDGDALTGILETRAAISEAARAANVGRIGELESQLRSQLAIMFALQAGDAALHGDIPLQQLANSIGQLNHGISQQREPYNHAVNQHNIRMAQFPASLIAALFGVRPATALHFVDGTTATTA